MKKFVLCSLLCLSFLGCATEPKRMKFAVGDKITVLGRPGIVTGTMPYDGKYWVDYVDEHGKIIRYNQFFDYMVEEAR